MNVVSGVMAAIMVAYNGSEASNFLIPPDVARQDSVPWWLLKKGRGRGPRRGSKRGTFNRSGSRKK